MALFEKSAKVFTGVAVPRGGEDADGEKDEVATLKAELDALRAKVDKLAR
jgi:hypothetical protein